VPSVEGGILDGIIGTNVFYNRNLVFRLNLTGTARLEVSDPVVLYYGDFDVDGDVDLADFGHFQDCANGPNRPPKRGDCQDADADRDNDVDTADFLQFQACFNGPNRPIRAECPTR